MSKARFLEVVGLSVAMLYIVLHFTVWNTKEAETGRRTAAEVNAHNRPQATNAPVARTQLRPRDDHKPPSSRQVPVATPRALSVAEERKASLRAAKERRKQEWAARLAGPVSPPAPLPNWMRPTTEYQLPQTWPTSWDHIESDLLKFSQRMGDFIPPSALPVVVISIPGSPRRDHSVMDMLKAMNLTRKQVVIFDGFVPDPTLSTELNFDKWWATGNTTSAVGPARPIGDRPLGALGCMISHMEVWHWMTIQRFPLALVLEDDTRVTPKWDGNLKPYIELVAKGAFGIGALHGCFNRLGTWALLVTLQTAECMWKNRLQFFSIAGQYHGHVDRLLWQGGWHTKEITCFNSSRCPLQHLQPFRHFGAASEKDMLVGCPPEFNTDGITCEHWWRDKMKVEKRKFKLSGEI